MLNNVWFIACIWMGLALVASLISIRAGISVALVEILVGLIAACFITDLGTVLALGTLFATYNLSLLVFVIVMLIALWFMPKWTQSIITRFGATRVSEPEVKFIFFILFFLGGLATAAKSEAVLPAYLIGLVVAGVFLREIGRAHV